MPKLLSTRLTLFRALLVICAFNVLLFSVAVISGKMRSVPVTARSAVDLQQRTKVTLVPHTNSTKTHSATTHPHTAPLLCMFTSFNTDQRKTTVNNNTLHNWAALKNNSTRKVQLILYMGPGRSGNNHSEALVTTAGRLGWTVVPVPRASSFGLPYLKNMYADAARRFPSYSFYGYANGDILFNRGMVDTLDAVEKQLHVYNSTLVIGRRYNVVWINFTLYRPDHVEQIAKRYGRLHVFAAEDYFFIARNSFPWNRLPDVVIARRGYDNFLVLMAIRQKVSVVDATATLVAVHQSDSEAKDPQRHKQEHEINMHRLGRFNFQQGLTTSSRYLTATVWDELSRKRTIVIRQRPPISPRKLGKRFGLRNSPQNKSDRFQAAIVRSTNRQGTRTTFAAFASTLLPAIPQKVLNNLEK